MCITRTTHLRLDWSGEPWWLSTLFLDNLLDDLNFFNVVCFLFDNVLTFHCDLLLPDNLRRRLLSALLLHRNYWFLCNWFVVWFLSKVRLVNSLRW